ncbi:MAG: MarC family protein [Nocardioidaceae bacterium]|jgi:multiple antibiotic resistance protein|nr:MarC family protein [Nocardioidaceae bacterium]MDQ3325681.1 MarC family protein [Actinomycetota bacterium]
MSSVVSVSLLAEVFITLFVIMDPPGTVPIFLALTSGQSPTARRRAAWQAVVVSFVVIVLFALFGRQLLDYLSVSLPALQAAGGLLLLLVALELLTGKAAEPSAAVDVNVAMVPLGTPLLAGPGAIVATMVFVDQVDGAPALVAVMAGIVGVHVALWLSMRFSVLILRLLGDSGVTLVTRISGLLLSAIAVQLVADAVRAFVTGSGSG